MYRVHRFDATEELIAVPKFIKVHRYRNDLPVMAVNDVRAEIKHGRRLMTRKKRKLLNIPLCPKE